MAMPVAPLGLPSTKPARVEPRRAPTFRDGFAPRPRLVQALRASGELPLVAVVAPAGYGKTALLSEWAVHEERPFGWLTVDDGCGSRTDFEAALEEALNALALLGRGGLERLRTRTPFVLAIDDVHRLEQGAVDLLCDLVERVPAGSQVAVASRAEPQLALGRLRTHRAVAEIRVRDLAMTRAEAHALLTLAGVDLEAHEVERLLERTEGWPAGLYLAALSVRDEADRAWAVEHFDGTETAVREYFRDEQLDRLPSDAPTFLRHASVLDCLNGPACDAVLNRRGSARLLSELGRRGAMLVPLDRSGTTFRFHRLFGDALGAELRRLEPEAEKELRQRASAWHEERGDIGAAVAQAIAAEDAPRAGELMWRSVPSCVAHGRNDVLRDWLGAFREDTVAAVPRLALTAAHSRLAAGELDLALRHTSSAERALRESCGDDSALDAAVALLHATFARNGLARMAADAEHAYDLESEDSPWRAACCVLVGAAHHLTGDREGARGALEEAVRRGAVAAPSVQTVALAQLALLASEAADYEGAATYVMRAVRQVDAYGLAAYPSSAAVYGVAAAVRAQRGQIEDARADLTRGRQLVDGAIEFVPWYELETRLALARAALRLDDVATARELLTQASRVARRAPDAIVLQQWLRELDTAVTALARASEPLTTAELRVLAFLPTHLSFREIADRLYVTANTVKTQAHSVYRKFDASSRSEAVARGVKLGLIDG